MNHLIPFYPKPYVALMDGIVVGGGMGVAQRGEANRMRVVTGRTMVRRSFENGEVLEGIRALVINKDNAPNWSPSQLADVSKEMVGSFFEPARPAHAHPLRALD